MVEVFPNYYKEFKCISDKCKHSCCIGWEIDVDEKTLSYYNSLNTPMGERIRRSIEGETPHFVLSQDERCPFLNERGLCDIITECGDDALCDICRLHPRFRNFYSDFYETGLGLCCEEAARIILSEKDVFRINLPPKVVLNDEEKQFFERRQEIFSVLQNRSKSIECRFSELSNMFGFDFDFSLPQLCDIYLSLERLDETWTDMLENLKCFNFDKSVFDISELQIPFEQLACYFVFRHLSDAAWYGDYAERISFSLMSCYLIGALWSQNKCLSMEFDSETMADIVRMYSSEIEYSEYNMECLL